MSLHLVIPAAGEGHRLGSSLPKALVSLGGRPLHAVTLDAFAGIPFASGVVTAPPGSEGEIARAAGRRFPVIAGGATRAESVALAVAAIDPGPRDFVVIHDAARPFVTAEDVERVLAAAEETGAAIAVIPVADTLKRWDGERLLGTVDREEITAAATPQVFRGDLLRRALEAPPATDEAARCEAVGIPVAAVPVSRLAFKITYPEDLVIAEAIARNLTPRPPLPVERGGRENP